MILNRVEQVYYFHDNQVLFQTESYKRRVWSLFSHFVAKRILAKLEFTLIIKKGGAWNDAVSQLKSHIHVAEIRLRCGWHLVFSFQSIYLNSLRGDIKILKLFEIRFLLQFHDSYWNEYPVACVVIHHVMWLSQRNISTA